MAYGGGAILSRLPPASSREPLEAAVAALGDDAGGISLGVVPAAVAVMALSAGVVRAEERLVQNHVPTELWSDAGSVAVSFGTVRRLSYFRVHGEQSGDRRSWIGAASRTVLI